MTRALLNKIAKAKKINLDHYDHVAAFINEQYTFIYVSFWAHEVVGGRAFRCCEKKVKLSVSSILKREEEFPEDYVTGPYGKWLWEVK